MDPRKRKSLESAGWKFGDYAEFLGLSAEERREVELRGALSNAVRRRREALGLSEKQMASKLKISKTQVANLELGIKVSLDLMFRALFILGGEWPIWQKQDHAAVNGSQVNRGVWRLGLG